MNENVIKECLDQLNLTLSNGLKNSLWDILIPILLTKLIEIGFFSADNKFIKKDIPERNLKMFMGIRIILGQGDCKHMSLFYRDIFKNSGQFNNRRKG